MESREWRVGNGHNARALTSAADRCSMFSPGDKVLVAVSGGPDSIALLHALHTRSSEFGITLHVAHLNHGIRGEAADLDAMFVQEYGSNLGLPVTVEKVDVPSIMREMGTGEEETARTLRYKFLRNTATYIGADKIALGHNADDRAETVLFNIIRGTGIGGLGSILPVQGDLVRPLIDTPRFRIEQYINEHSLPYRVDESNFDTTYTRNRIRHDLIPLLERDYNPRVKDALVRLAEIAAMDHDLVLQLAKSRRMKIARRDGIDVQGLLNTPPAVQYELLLREIAEHRGDDKDITFEQVRRIIDALRSGEDFKITLPSGVLYAVRESDVFRIEHKTEPPSVEQFLTKITIPGVTEIGQVGMRIEAEIIENPVAQKTPQCEALIDADKLAGPLQARMAWPGDRMRPFGMKGTKKLHDVFIDKKIPRDQRARTVVITDNEKIVWVVGVAVSDDVRIEKSTRRAIYLKAAPDR